MEYEKKVKLALVLLLLAPVLVMPQESIVQLLPLRMQEQQQLLLHQQPQITCQQRRQGQQYAVSHLPPVSKASPAAHSAQTTTLAHSQLSALRLLPALEAVGCRGNCCSSTASSWSAARAAAAPAAAKAVDATRAAAFENAAMRALREEVAAATATTRDAPSGLMLLAWRLRCSNYQGRPSSDCSSNINNSSGSSSSKYGIDSCCSRDIYESSRWAGDSSCYTSRGRRGSAALHRPNVNRIHFAACTSSPASVSAASAAANREQQLALHALKNHSGSREQELRQQQQFQQDEDKDPKMLQIMRTHAFLHLTSGAVAGAVSRTATAPLDRVKVMLQLQPFSVPLRQAARVIMQQELSGKASAAALAPTATLATAAPSSSNNARSSSSTDQRPTQPSRSDGRTPSLQSNQQQGMRPGVRPTSALASSSSSSSCCSNSNSINSRGHLLLGGWRGFFRGNLTNCLKVVPETAVKFYSYDICKHALAHRKQQQQQQQPQQQQQAEPAEPHLQLLDRFLCGATAGLCAQLLIYPMELVKTRLAAYGPGCMYTGVLQCFRAIYREGGFRRLYRGVGPSLLGIIPYAGIDLAVFETLKEAYVQRVIIPKQKEQLEQQLLLRSTCSNCNPEASPAGMVPFTPDAATAAGGPASAAGLSRVRCCCDESSSGLPPASPPAAVLLLMGGCSSLIGQVLAYPTALVRTRMQVDGSGGQPLLYRSSTAAAAEAIRQGGLRGLYRGLQANCCKALPAVSLSWIVYEKMKYAIGSIERDWTQKIEQQRLAARNRQVLQHPQ
ncbi:mitochondrial carrier domain-containing protein, putative [Eimeria praecox]|uniref:Mitochondrial carrier domain-containing protein, putative n=1 Tax=Eimeria praecox TaxID=51316 RepID=U6H4M1_9EIME|nr:mitochondrial carrier domain-containing protein, putative [Eimeria praecox]